MPDYSRFTIHLVGHAHIDLAYRWRWNETVHRVGRDTFRGVLNLMEQDGELTFVQSQMALYEAMEREYPELFAAIKERIAEGRWFAADGWAEYDQTMPCGEAMIRQHLVGSDYARNKLGVEIDTAWAADAFSGHTNTLPSILAGCGIKYLMFGRGMPKDTPFFWWKGPDGSKVLAYSPVFGYGGAIGPHMVERLEQWEAWGAREMMVFYGRGDHGGGPREQDLAALEDLRAQPGAPRFVHADPRRFFAEVLEPRTDLVDYQGELGMPWVSDPGEGNFAGSCSSESRNKQRNRQAENQLLTAERFATLSTFFQRKPTYPRVDFEKAWKLVLRHQFHDELPGTCRGQVFEDNARDYDWVAAEMTTILDHALGEISARVDTRGEGTPVMVYNPLAWSRSESVQATLRLAAPPSNLVIRDGRGAAMPTQVLATREDGHFWLADVLFVTQDVPPMGFKLFRAFEDAAAKPGVRVVETPAAFQLASDLFAVRVDRATGQVTSIYDRRAGRETLAAPANVLQAIREEAGQSSGWMIALTDDVAALDRPDYVELVERGPVRATVRVGYRYQDSYFEQEISLVAGAPRVAFHAKLDWHERDCTLKVAFPLSVVGGVATFEQPFGSVVRPANGDECHAQYWIDLSNQRQGASLLNDCRYAFDIKGNTMRMTLLRGIPDLDPLADEGRHEVSYALYPHGADWQAATVRQGFEVNYPLLARQPMRRAGLVRPWGVPGQQQAVSPEFAFLKVGQENVVVTAVKMEHEDWGQFSPFVVRLYETAGLATTATLDLAHSLRFAERTDHLERLLPVQDLQHEGRRVTIALKPHEIVTLRMAFVLPSFAVHEEGDEEYQTPSTPDEANTFEVG